MMSSPPGHLKFRADARGEFRWRVKAANHEIVGAATEGYKELRDARANARLLLAALEQWMAHVRDPSIVLDPSLPLVKFAGSGRDYRWRAIAANGRIIGASTESFTSLGICEANAMLLLRALSHWATEVDAGRPYDDMDHSARVTGEWAAQTDDEDDA